MTEPVEFGDEPPVALYRLYDADGVLLYVGITRRLISRMTAHSRHQRWWLHVTRKTAAFYPSREAAELAEKEAIRTEQPVYNVVHTPRAREIAIAGYLKRRLA